MSYRFRSFIFCLTFLLISACNEPATLDDAKPAKTESGLDEQGDGIRTQTFADGSVKAKIPYKNKQRHGTGELYYENGNPQLVIDYKFGKKDGIEKYYYEEGGLYRVSRLKEGKLDSIQVFYHKNGKLMAEVPYKEDRLCAGTKEFASSGKPLSSAKILIETVDQTALNSTYKFRLSMNRKFTKIAYYTLEEAEDKTCPLTLYPVGDVKGKIEHSIFIPKGQFLMGEVFFAAECQSMNRIPHLITERMAINVSNR